MPIYRLTQEIAFPPPSLAQPDGLLAVGGDLRVPRLLLAYRMGIFPWYSEDSPILWWSPDPRMVLFPAEFHFSRSLRRTIKSGEFSVTADRAFEEVVSACAEPAGEGRESTWITPEMCAAYIKLHREGWAHSFETWRDGKLVGGLYGVSLGAAFFGESMFFRAPNASKVAVAALMAVAQPWHFAFVDCQVANPHLTSLGAREIPRASFLHLLSNALHKPTHHGPWTDAVHAILEPHRPK